MAGDPLRCETHSQPASAGSCKAAAACGMLGRAAATSSMPGRVDSIAADSGMLGRADSKLRIAAGWAEQARGC